MERFPSAKTVTVFIFSFPHLIVWRDPGLLLTFGMPPPNPIEWFEPSPQLLIHHFTLHLKAAFSNPAAEEEGQSWIAEEDSCPLSGCSPVYVYHALSLSLDSWAG